MGAERSTRQLPSCLTRVQRWTAALARVALTCRPDPVTRRAGERLTRAITTQLPLPGR